MNILTWRRGVKRVVLAAAGVAVILGAGSCAPQKPRQTPFMRQFGTVTISASELRLRLLDYTHDFASLVERTSILIRDLTDDPEIEEHALLWKMRLIPSLQMAAFRPDPLVTFIDLWALAIQQREFFKSGDGSQMFGDLQPLAVDAADVLVAELMELGGKIGTGEKLEGAEAAVVAWAMENPITQPTYRRTSAAAELAESAYGATGRGLAAIGTLDERMELVIERLPFYTEYLPKQAVWQAELTLVQSGKRVREDVGLAELEALRSLESVDESLRRVATAADRLEVIVADERSKIAEIVATQLAETRRELTADIDRLRTKTIEEAQNAVGAERMALMAEVRAIVEAERAVALQEIERQRIATIERADLEIAELVTAAEQIAQDSVRDSVTEADAIVRRIMHGLTIRFGVMGAVFVAIVFFITRRPVVVQMSAPAGPTGA